MKTERTNLLISKLIPLGILNKSNYDTVIVVEDTSYYIQCFRRQFSPSSPPISIISPKRHLCGFRIEKAFIDDSISYDVTNYISEVIHTRLVPGGKTVKFSNFTDAIVA